MHTVNTQAGGDGGPASGRAADIMHRHMGDSPAWGAGASREEIDHHHEQMRREGVRQLVTNIY